MTAEEYKLERRHIFETRLAILEAGSIPTAEQQNMAMEEADAHIVALRKEDRRGAIKGLLEFADTL
jgi:hypothetical protein